MANDDVDGLRGQHVPGPDGYRFGSLERDSGEGVRLQLVDANGNEIGWAAGATRHALIQDAKQKTAAHAADRA